LNTRQAGHYTHLFNQFIIIYLNLHESKEKKRLKKQKQPNTTKKEGPTSHAHLIIFLECICLRLALRGAPSWFLARVFFK